MYKVVIHAIAGFSKDFCKDSVALKYYDFAFLFGPSGSSGDFRRFSLSFSIAGSSLKLGPWKLIGVG